MGFLRNVSQSDYVVPGMRAPREIQFTKSRKTIYDHENWE